MIDIDNCVQTRKQTTFEEDTAKPFLLFLYPMMPRNAGIAG